MRLPDCLQAVGFEKRAHTDATALDGMATWVFGENVRLVLRSESLGVDRGTVWRYDAEGLELTLHKLEVAVGARRQGKASEALTALLNVTDALGFTMYLEPLPYEKGTALTAANLQSFYSALGFMATDVSGKVMKRAAPRPR